MLKLALRSLRAHRGRLSLTVVAVTLAVGFVTAGFVLADSLRAVFGDVSSQIYEGVDAEIRAADGDFDRLESGQRFAEDSIVEASAIEGVASVIPSIGARETVFTVDNDGEVVRSVGPPTLTFSVNGSGEASAFTLATGTWPEADQIALDTAQASVLGVDVGDQVQVVTPSGTEAFVLSGTVVFGDSESGVSPYFLLFDLRTTQELLGAQGMIDSATVVFDPGTDVTMSLDAITTALPEGLMVADQATLVDEQNGEFGQIIDVIQIALLGFAFVTLIVSTFVIANTFSVLVGRQQRQIGMLRAIGATGGQAVSLVVGEAALVGLIASGLGIGAGVGVAELIKSLFEAVTDGGGFPAGPTLIEPRTIAVALIVGVGVTVLSALIPARRAGKTPPMEALRADSSTQSDSNGRVLQGIAGATIGRLGVAGELAASGVARNPRRVLATSMSMIVGMTLIGAITVLATSYQATVANSVATAYDGQAIVTGDDGVTVPYEAIAELTELDQVEAASGFGVTEVLVSGEVEPIAGYLPETASGVVVLDSVEGKTGPVGDHEAIITTTFADAQSLSAGDQFSVVFSDETTVQLAVLAIVEETVAFNAGVLVDADLIAAHARNVNADYGVVRFSEGVTPAAGIKAIEAVLAERPQLAAMTMDDYVAVREATGTQLVTLANLLLALTIVVALVGIANTITLSMLERRRELGLLRAVGLSRRQLRAMVSYEAATLAAIGATSGLVLGVLVALAAGPFIPEAVVSTIEVPVTPLVSYLSIAVALGVVAAILPARRTARVPVLDALRTES